MKKVLAISLVLIIISTFLYGCGENNANTSYSITDKVESAVKNRITAKVMINYDVQGSPQITYYTKQISENEYSVSGKVVVRDKYGDNYEANYDATVIYDSTNDSYNESVNLGDFYKK